MSLIVMMAEIGVELFESLVERAAGVTAEVPEFGRPADPIEGREILLVRDCARESIELHVIITSHHEDIVALCERPGVRRLDVFGSATTPAFDAVSSDVDFLVEFADPYSPSYFDDFFTLKEGLEHILERPVDLVTRTSIENPYFLQRVEETREGLYAA